MTLREVLAVIGGILGIGLFIAVLVLFPPIYLLWAIWPDLTETSVLRTGNKKY